MGENNEIDFKALWKKKCSKYNLDSDLISIFPMVRRIIVIGDLHGSYDIMIKSLKIAKLIDDKHKWTGTDTYVVIVGDQIDNCRPSSGQDCNVKGTLINDTGNDWKILKYLTLLNLSAVQEKGRVISLLGNHEIMNVEGDLRYVSYESIKEFGTKENRLKLFKPGNDIALFLACTRQVAVIIGKNLFVHAGIVSHIAEKYSIESINQIMTLFLLDKFNKKSENKFIYDHIYKQKHIVSKEEQRDIFYNETYSPLWNRIYGYMGYFYENNDNTIYQNEDELKMICSKHLNVLKNVYHVEKIYVGHTPMLKNGITSVCDGKVWLTDYGSSHAFDKYKDPEELNNISVLEILNDGENINILK